MIDEEAMKQLAELNQLYKTRWGKEVDYSIVPQMCSQTDLVAILKRIVDTGESVLVGWNKLHSK